MKAKLVDGVLTIAASEHRQQLRNRQAARERMTSIDDGISRLGSSTHFWTSILTVLREQLSYS